MLRLCLSSAATSSTGASAAAPLCLCRRFQRSTSARVRTSTWEEKTQKFEARQREQQAEAERAARRRARYATAASSQGWEGGRQAPGSEGEATTRKGAASASTSSLAANLTQPARGFWNFIKGGSKGRRSQPLNPLMYLERVTGKSKFDPDARAAQRIIDAVNGLRQRNSRRQSPMTVQLSEEEKQEIVSRYAETRWYAALYRPFRHITDRQIRWTVRISHIGLLLICVGFLVMVLLVYMKEMDMVAKLSPEDQRDYAYMVQHMRYSDIYNTGKVVLDRDDPLEALPPEVRLHMAIEACREKKWHELDWEVELRKMHPKTAMEEYDYLHLFYWTMMEVGRAMTGGGSLFSDRVLDVQRARQGVGETPEERDRFVEMEPTALPAKTKRGFFS